jgi:lipopolysaccharide export system permease protein
MLVIVFRYLFREIYSALLVSTLVVLLVLIANQFIHYLNDAAIGFITFSAVMQVMSLQVPLLLGYLLPLGLFLGILLGLSRLSVDRELIVMFACGISRMQLVKMVLGISTLVILIIAWLMLIAEPSIERYRQTILSRAMSDLTIAKLIPGRFQYLDDSDARWVFYTQSINRSLSQLNEVFFAHKTADDATNQVKWDLVTAAHAKEVYRADQKTRFLVFENGYRTIGVPGQNDYQIIKYKNYGIRLGGVRTLPFRSNVKAMPTSQLLPFIFKRPDMAAEFHWRLAMPISAIILAIIAVSLTYTNPRLGRFAKFFPAIIIYIVYGNLLFVGRAWLMESKISLLWGMWWIHGIFLCIAIALLGQYLQWWDRLFRKKRQDS